MPRGEVLSELKVICNEYCGDGTKISESERMTIWALNTAIDMIDTRPDPETGLVKCGCGGNLKLRYYAGEKGEYNKKHFPDEWNKTPGYWVECNKCFLKIGHFGEGEDEYHINRGIFDTEEEAIKAANTAMGYKEGAE